MEITIKDIEEQVCEDILRRQQLGITKYGTTVAANPLELKAWLTHLYEEVLDQAVYIKRAIAEIEREHVELFQDIVKSITDADLID